MTDYGITVKSLMAMHTAYELRRLLAIVGITRPVRTRKSGLALAYWNHLYPDASMQDQIDQLTKVH